MTWECSKPVKRSSSLLSHVYIYSEIPANAHGGQQAMLEIAIDAQSLSDRCPPLGTGMD